MTTIHVTAERTQPPAEWPWKGKAVAERSGREDVESFAWGETDLEAMVQAFGRCEATVQMMRVTERGAEG